MVKLYNKKSVEFSKTSSSGIYIYIYNAPRFTCTKLQVFLLGKSEVQEEAHIKLAHQFKISKSDWMELE